MNPKIVLICVLLAIGLGLLVHWQIFATSSRANLKQDIAIAGQLADMREVTSQLRAEVAALRNDILAVGKAPSADGHPASIENNAINEGATVNVGGDSVKRDWLKNLPQLRTSEMSFLLDVTPETITNRIEREPDGSMWYTHGGKKYSVQTEGNTFLFDNPFGENRR